MTNVETTGLTWSGWAGPALRWLTGPIFDKEMRVSSRRRRNYALRFVYIALFTFLMAIIWLDDVAHNASSVYQVSRMASAGQQLIMAVLWFQFLTAQVIAIVMLSTSISDEIYKRTLGVLMTTPIGSLQIVLGKLTSRLLQVVLLLAISLPLLAVVRVFGGVPWDYLLCGLCVTLTTVIFLGSLSLFFSIFTRRAYAAIIQTILATGFLFGFIPLVTAFAMMSSRSSGARFVSLFCYVNPYMMMSVATDAMMSARIMLIGIWPWHCVVMLGASTVLLLLAVIFVRKAALRQAGGLSLLARRAPAGAETQPALSSLRRVVGPPVLWKECRVPLLGKRKVATVVTALVALGMLLVTYGLCAKEHALKEPPVHTMYTVVFFSLGLLFTMVLPATCITTERESQTWPLLLTTTVENAEILWSKFAGALRRCLPVWGLLFGHVLVFTLAGVIHPIAAVQLAILVAWVLLFLTGTGLYFSLRFRHTTTAVIANMGLAAGLWAVFPLFLAILLEVSRMHNNVIEPYIDMNPFVQAVVIVSAAAHKGGLAAYDWVQGGMKSPPEATAWLVLTFAVYVSVGLAFLLRTAARLRRNPF
jgi:ABC-type transport system involved in multi-copper enzyme maturation permease subunit